MFYRNMLLSEEIYHNGVLCILTVGDGEQRAVRCVQITRRHIVPLSWPVNGGIVLDIQLLGHREQDTMWFTHVWISGVCECKMYLVFI